MCILLKSIRSAHVKANSSYSSMATTFLLSQFIRLLSNLSVIVFQKHDFSSNESLLSCQSLGKVKTTMGISKIPGTYYEYWKYLCSLLILSESREVKCKSRIASTGSLSHVKRKKELYITHVLQVVTGKRESVLKTISCRLLKLEARNVKPVTRSTSESSS